MFTLSPSGRVGLVALSTVLGAVPIFAQSNRLPPARPPGTQPALSAAVRPAPPARSQRLSELLNSTVFLSSGAQAGEIRDIVIGPTGQVDYLVAITPDERWYAIPYEAAVLDPAQHQVRVPLTTAEFNSMLFFTVRTWPNFDDRDYRLRLARVFHLNEDARLSRQVTPAVEVVPPAIPSVETTVPVVPRTRGLPLPGATETGVRGRGTGTGTGAAAIGGAGAAGAPGGAAAGANKPIPSGPVVPQKP
jgi:hypothetical protein